MKTVKDYTEKLEGEAYEYRYNLKVIPVEDVHEMMNEYASQFIDFAIDQCGICCNNFDPAIGQSWLIKIKESIK